MLSQPPYVAAILLRQTTPLGAVTARGETIDPTQEGFGLTLQCLNMTDEHTVTRKPVEGDSQGQQITGSMEQAA